MLVQKVLPELTPAACREYALPDSPFTPEKTLNTKQGRPERDSQREETEGESTQKDDLGVPKNYRIKREKIDFLFNIE